MIDLSAAQITALGKAHVHRRLFIWVDAVDPDTGDPAPAGFWDDASTVTLGSRTYTGSGTLIQVASLSAMSNFTIPGLEVTLSGLDPATNALVRGETVGQRPIEVHIGIFDTDNHELIGDLIPYFVGFIDDVEIVTPKAGGNGFIKLVCESTSRALTIKRTATRSDATHHERDAQDDFFTYTGLQRTKPLYFGQQDPR